MTECLTSFVDEVKDLYGNFDIVDGDSGDDLTVSSPTEAREDYWWIETDEKFFLRSADREGGVYVRFELWSGPPPKVDPSWKRSWSGRVRVPSGKVQAREYLGSDNHKTFDLGCADVEWSVEVHAKTLGNDVDPDFPPDIFRVELFKLRFWRYDPCPPAHIPAPSDHDSRPSRCGRTLAFRQPRWLNGRGTACLFACAA
ncbi:hypothetical protein [Microbispora bryophytorum]|uniref:Uncharacterized protein n=1 Tax=Microbispora bryophytorum TaxID=1460882 RepID=A0A8H9H6H9_9ACTN|nr:hypothetical protein [Microbispora bryophytorum]MBD3136494.1 hypothetical protein [Microbispora bryophytorum]TQS01657.1 hypothetical protein FLX07_31735 [Microbispora bryophytorum]GGO18686.1 hypothetical protein GCM10011574_43550 [Microbispora bryophytorum]